MPLPTTAPPDARRAVGDKLRLLRNQAGITQAQLAEAALVNQAMVAKYESGAHVPHPAIQHRIAAALGVDHVRLFGEVQ
jgi:transcriptional regulator with XRE-family HTH domain